MSWLSNEIQICDKISYISGITKDGSEYIFRFYAVDGHSVFLLYLRKPAGDS